jgi:hypothetical protein
MLHILYKYKDLQNDTCEYIVNYNSRRALIKTTVICTQLPPTKRPLPLIAWCQAEDLSAQLSSTSSEVPLGVLLYVLLIWWPKWPSVYACINAFQISNISIAIMLRAGRRSKLWFPADATDFLFSKTSGPALQPTQPPVQWVGWWCCRGAAVGAGSWSLTSI